VGAYPPNGYGLFDIIGNVWEWTVDWFAVPKPARKTPGACCVPANPRGGTERESLDPCTPHVPIGRKVLKGGSHLCAENYCQRYRPAARHPQPVDSSTSHIGFRCIIRDNMEDMPS
jgi:sulfatase modifying factor 1